MDKEFTVGQILSRSFDTFARNLPFMLLVGLLASLPTTLILMVPDSVGLSLLAQLANHLMGLVVQGVAVYGVFQHLTGRRVVFSESLSVALGRFLALFLISLTVGLLTGLGFLLLIVPGVIVYLVLWVAVPVTMVEKGGVGHALERSRDLTTGYRLRIFALTVIMGIIYVAAFGILAGLFAMLAAAGLLPGTTAYALASLPLNLLTIGLVSALSSVVVTVGYFTLRHEVEGVATEDLAAVFE